MGLAQVVDGMPEEFGKGQVSIQHALNESGAFSDEALAELINSYPREYYMLTNMTSVGEKPVWRNGDMGHASGEQVLKAIQDGQLWLALRRLDLNAPHIYQMIVDGMDELRSETPGFPILKQESTMLISSPNARVFYHADIPMVCLWHMRGAKRVWVYDPQNEEHLPHSSMEGIVLRETEEEIFYDDAWDEEAKIVELHEGEAVSWPLNAPHRVDNLEGLNVSVTTEFFTPEARRKYGVNYLNGYMRRYMSKDPKNFDYNGFSAYMKCAAAVAIKKLGLVKGQEREMLCKFVIDMDAPDFIKPLAEDEYWAIHQA